MLSEFSSKSIANYEHSNLFSFFSSLSSSLQLMTRIVAFEIHGILHRTVLSTGRFPLIEHSVYLLSTQKDWSRYIPSEDTHYDFIFRSFSVKLRSFSGVP